ncbi:hypothetical protein GQ44DRAFT_768558 [Phaeosphaeriaceae sp. PMI808]|nr:hypothetical protein GQ44DRAFT_768558 [Phaeosphaeriaceae sp. PMI808]
MVLGVAVSIAGLGERLVEGIKTPLMTAKPLEAPPRCADLRELGAFVDIGPSFGHGTAQPSVPPASQHATLELGLDSS